MMNKFPAPFAIVLVLVTIALAAIFFVPGINKAPQTQNQSADALVMSAAYTVSARDIIATYRKTETPAAAKVAENKLLNLTVPSERRDTHLDLILALHKFAAVKPSDAKAVQAARTHVDEVIQKSSWLE